MGIERSLGNGELGFLKLGEQGFGVLKVGERGIGGGLGTGYSEFQCLGTWILVHGLLEVAGNWYHSKICFSLRLVHVFLLTYVIPACFSIIHYP